MIQLAKRRDVVPMTRGLYPQRGSAAARSIGSKPYVQGHLFAGRRLPNEVSESQKIVRFPSPRRNGISWGRQRY